MSAPALSGAAASLLTPLWCRAECARRYPALGVGGEDFDILRSLSGADFSAARRSDCALYGLRELLVREAAGAYLAERPGALLVDLGCGLDTVLRRVGGECGGRVFVDLTETMELRRRLLPPRPGERFCVSDLRSGEFFESFCAPNGAFFVMSGLLCHLERPLVILLLRELAGRFPGCGAAFDGLAFARGGLSSLPGENSLRALGFAGVNRVSSLPDPCKALPMPERLKLRALLGSGFLRFYSVRC